MRVVYVHQYFRTREAAGGTRSYEFARHLARQGWDVHVVTTATQASSVGVRWRTEQADGLTVHRLAVPYSNHMGFLRRLWAFLVFAARSCSLTRSLRGDVVIATSTPLTVALPMLWARWGRPTGTVFEVRDLWPEMPIAVGALRNPALRAAARWLERLAYAGADEVIALSPGMRDGVTRVRPRARVTVVPNAADIDLFRVAPDVGLAWRRRHGFGERQPLVVYVGTLGRVNDVGYLVDLAAEVRTRNDQVAFVVVGDGADRSAIEERAARLGVLGRNVALHPPVAKNDVPEILSAATVCTSLFLPLPEMEANSANKFFDALAAGRPVAVNYGGWQAEAITREGAGIVLSRDVPTAAEQLLALLSDPSGLSRCADGAARLADEFARSTLAEQFHAVVAAALRAGQARRRRRVG